MILYGQNIFSFSRRKTIEVKVGNIPVGGRNPIRVQSMITPDTMDKEAVVAQSIRLINVGCEYIRLTTPSLKEAKFLKEIKLDLVKLGYDTPLIADVHYTPNAALEAAKNVEKVRINPGNYISDKKLIVQDNTMDTLEHEVSTIRNHLLPLINLCKDRNVALRIGTNHGSLSDRIMRRYGDTPIGMVESALEYIRVCHQEGFDNIVISMKSSNPQVMVHAYRLLVKQLLEEQLPPYPLHLGVTEAGEGEDGRVRSAIGVGTLLADGIGDTVRVSLTEEPELEIPVAKQLVNRFKNLKPEVYKVGCTTPYNPYTYEKQATRAVGIIGGGQVPVVISSLPSETFKNALEQGQKSKDAIEIKRIYSNTNDQSPDFLHLNHASTGHSLGLGIPIIVDSDDYYNKKYGLHAMPLFTISQYLSKLKSDKQSISSIAYCFIEVDTSALDIIVNNKDIFITSTNVIFVLKTRNKNRLQAFRHFLLTLKGLSILSPTLLKIVFDNDFYTHDNVILESSSDVGGLLIDGYGDGIWLEWHTKEHFQPILSKQKLLLQLSFNILQASRQRVTKTEYISCPSCGRTLFDLQETTAKIRKRTEHLKGLKIGIMGCIVNGPGEMADADYGYVGSGKNQITLYRGMSIVKRGVPTDQAVDALIAIIKEDNLWVEP